MWRSYVPSWSQSCRHLSVIGAPCDFQSVSFGSDRNCSVISVSILAPFESLALNISLTYGINFSLKKYIRLVEVGVVVFEERREGGEVIENGRLDLLVRKNMWFCHSKSALRLEPSWLIFCHVSPRKRVLIKLLNFGHISPVQVKLKVIFIKMGKFVQMTNHDESLTPLVVLIEFHTKG